MTVRVLDLRFGHPQSHESFFTLYHGTPSEFEDMPIRQGGSALFPVASTRSSNSQRGLIHFQDPDTVSIDGVRRQWPYFPQVMLGFSGTERRRLFVAH